MILTLADLKKGDIVSGWVYTGSSRGRDHQALVYTRVVRVNRVTVTVRYVDGHLQRVDPYHLNDFAPKYVIDALREEGRLP